MIQNLNSLKEARENKLSEFAAKIAEQYGVTDPKEIKIITKNILTRYNPNRPLAATPVIPPKSNSALYRNYVRMLYIDLVSYLIQIQFIDSVTRNIEISSRSTFESLKGELFEMNRGMNLTASDMNIKETFSENKGALYQNTIAYKNSQVTLEPTISSKANSEYGIDIKVYPVESVDAYHMTIGSADSILKSGVHSDLWSASVWCKNRPELVWNDAQEPDNYAATAPVNINGIMAAVEIKTKYPLKLNTISADFLTFTKVVRMYYKTAEGKWRTMRDSDGNILSTDANGSLLMNNILQGAASNAYKIILAVETPSLLSSRIIERPLSVSFEDSTAGKLNSANVPVSIQDTFSHKYVLGIYNIKLLENVYPAAGTYTSAPYIIPEEEIRTVSLKEVTESKTSTDCYQQYFIEFMSEGAVTHRLPILPQGSLDVTEILPVIHKDNKYILHPSFYVHQNLRVDGVFLPSFFQSINKIILNNVNEDNPPTSVKVSYKTDFVNGIGYFTSDDKMHISKPETEGFTIRYVSPDNEGIETVDIRKVRPVFKKQIVEVFKKAEGNMLTLRSPIHIDYSAYDWVSNTWDGINPVEVKVRTKAGEDFVTAIDKTNYGRPLTQPWLDDFELNNEIQFYIYKNQVHLNIIDFSETTVTYLSKADAFKLSIHFNSNNSALTGIVHNYRITLNE